MLLDAKSGHYFKTKAGQNQRLNYSVILKAVAA